MRRPRNPIVSSNMKRYTSATRKFWRGARSRIPGIHAIRRGFPFGEFSSGESSIICGVPSLDIISFKV